MRGADVARLALDPVAEVMNGEAMSADGRRGSFEALGRKTGEMYGVAVEHGILRLRRFGCTGIEVPGDGIRQVEIVTGDDFPRVGVGGRVRNGRS